MRLYIGVQLGTVMFKLNQHTMMAQLRHISDVPSQSTRMKVPTIEEVSDYIMQKMQWVEPFCDYYADKFWNHYQASGWKLSNGNTMKDWKAAFNSQWQRLKYKEDIEVRDQMTKEHKKTITPISYLNDSLELHKLGKYKPKTEEVLNIFGWLKENGYINRLLTKDEIDRCVEIGNGVKDRMRMQCVKLLFDKMVSKNDKFI